MWQEFREGILDDLPEEEARRKARRRLRGPCLATTCVVGAVLLVVATSRARSQRPTGACHTASTARATARVTARRRPSALGDGCVDEVGRARTGEHSPDAGFEDDSENDYEDKERGSEDAAVCSASQRANVITQTWACKGTSMMAEG